MGHIGHEPGILSEATWEHSRLRTVFLHLIWYPSYGIVDTGGSPMKRIFPKLSLIVFTLFSLVPFCRAVTRHVPDDYATIQLAIDASAHGDVVELAEGIYCESIDFMSKAITVRAADGQLCEISNHGCCQINITNVEDGFAVLEGINLFKNDFNSENQGTLNIADSSVRVTNCDFKENITDIT